jgi:hypothetical protein
LTGLRVQPGAEARVAEPIEHPVSEREVHVADEIPVLVDQGVERAVLEPDLTRGCRSRFVPTILE